jgi:hypothetical protein
MFASKEKLAVINATINFKEICWDFLSQTRHTIPSLKSELKGS